MLAKNDKLALNGMWAESCETLFKFGPSPTVSGMNKARHFKFGGCGQGHMTLF